MNLVTKRLNREELTIEKLREFPGFENVNDQEAEIIVNTVKSLALIIYKNFDALLAHDKSQKLKNI